MYKLDRTAFKSRSHSVSDSEYKYWTSKSIEERFKAAAYLNSVGYNYDINNPPRLDRTYFRAGKRLTK